jgi:hypothetical protein
LLYTICRISTKNIPPALLRLCGIQAIDGFVDATERRVCVRDASAGQLNPQGITATPTTA